MKLFYCILIFLALFAHTSFAQKDTAKVKIKTSYSTFDLMGKDINSMKEADTSVYCFHEFDAAIGLHVFGINTGIIGSPFLDLNNFRTTKSAFETGIYNFDLYSITHDSLRFYNTHTPFTDLYYVQGGQDLQILRAIHSRNIRPNWNMTADFKTSGSAAYFLNQKTKVNNLQLTTNYLSSDSIYRLYAAYFTDKFNEQVNGGMADSLFFQYRNSERAGLDVCLNEAKQVYFSRNILARQYLQLGRKSDSLSSSKKGNIYLMHQLKLSFQKYAYTDNSPNLDYYKSVFLDSAKTQDTFGARFVTNDFMLMNYPAECKSTSFRFGFSHMGAKITQNDHDSLLSSFSANALIKNRIGPINNLLFAKYVLSGANQGDYQASDILAYRFNSYNRLALSVDFRKTAAPYFYQYAATNHLTWRNDFDAEKRTELSLLFDQEKYHFHLCLKYASIENMVYIDRNILPVQYSDPLRFWGAELSKNTKIWRFRFDNHLLVQFTPGTDVLRLPLWRWNSLFYYSGNIAKDVLHINLGFALRVSASGKGYAYYAPFNLFYLHDDNIQQLYPVADLFLNAALKSVTFFVKYEHVNQGFLFDEQFVFSNYPIYPRTFTFGVSWLFFD